MSSFFEMYESQVRPKLKAKFGYKNAMLIPKVEKVILSTCLSEALQTPKLIDTAALELAAITGQKPMVTHSKKAIAAFKLRAGVPLGLKVTLRGKRMHEFLNRLFNVALPRVRDFRGLDPKGFDGRGNYNFGVTEQIMFQEINFDKVEKLIGMNITVVTSANSDDEARELLKELGMPFRLKDGENR